MEPNLDSQEKLLMMFYTRFLSSPEEENILRKSENLFLSMETPSLTLNDFTSYVKKKGIIYHLSPIIADNLKRCVSFDNITEVMMEYDISNQKKLKYQKISPRNLIEFFIQITPPKIHIILGSYLYKMMTSIPLTYWKFEHEAECRKYQIDLSVLFDIMPELNKRTIIMNFGFDSKIGKTEILARLFDIDKRSLNIDDDIGIARESTIDLYLVNKFAIIDINDFDEEVKTFKKFIKKLIQFADCFLFHIASNKTKSLKKKFKKLKDIGFEDFDKFFVILRDKPEKCPEELEDYFKKLKKKFNQVGFIRNLNKISENKVQEQILSIRTNFRNWLDACWISTQDKKEPRFSFDNILKISKHFSCKNMQEDFQMIENLFNKSFYHKEGTPFEKILPFTYQKFMNYKRFDDLNAHEKKSHLEENSINLKDLLSYHFAKFSFQEKILESRKFDEKIKGLTCEFVENSISKIKSLNTQFKKNPTEQLKLALKDEIEVLTNNSISFYDFYSELFSFYNHKKNEKFNNFSVEEQKFFNDLKGFFSGSFLSGTKLQLLGGIPLKIRNV